MQREVGESLLFCTEVRVSFFDITEVIVNSCEVEACI